MRVLLDTVTFIWAVSSPGSLSRRAMSALRSEAVVREISSVSIAEIAIKQTRGKLTFGQDDILAGLADLRVRVLPYTADHALRLFDLPLHHPDPFDRQIIAQAIRENIPVVTCDEKFSLYKEVEVLW
jgi:PIN domain nuclease of toxin-antitoxin system